MLGLIAVPLAHHALVLALPFAGPAILVLMVIGWISFRDRRRERRS
jgi:hypothetical protein